LFRVKSGGKVITKEIGKKKKKKTYEPRNLLNFNFGSASRALFLFFLARMKKIETLKIKGKKATDMRTYWYLKPSTPHCQIDLKDQTDGLIFSYKFNDADMTRLFNDNDGE